MPQNKYNSRIIKNNDKIEIVHFIGVDRMKKDIFKIDKKVFKSRLIVGTGKYKNLLETAKQ